MTKRKTVTISDITISSDLSVIEQYLTQSEDLLLILLCQSGRLRIDVQEQVINMQPNDLLFTTPRDVVGHYTSTPDVACIICVTPLRMMKDVVFSCLRTENNWYDKFEYIKRNPLLHLTDTELQLLGGYAQTIYLHHQVYGTTIDRVVQQLKQAVISEFMLLMDRHMIQDKEYISSLERVVDANSSRGQQLFYQFAQLLSSNYMRRLPVGWYADELSITAKYLTFICRQTIGKTPSSLIDEVMMQEIKKRLLDTNDTIKEIAYAMNYGSARSFCKFFRQKMGISPLQFRQQNR